MAKMTPKMQMAAVVAALKEGSTLDQIERDHPELADAIKERREKGNRSLFKRGSGPSERLPSPRTKFTI